MHSGVAACSCWAGVKSFGVVSRVIMSSLRKRPIYLKVKVVESQHVFAADGVFGGLSRFCTDLPSCAPSAGSSSLMPNETRFSVAI